MQQKENTETMADSQITTIKSFSPRENLLFAQFI